MNFSLSISGIKVVVKIWEREKVSLKFAACFQILHVPCSFFHTRDCWLHNFLYFNFSTVLMYLLLFSFDNIPWIHLKYWTYYISIWQFIQYGLNLTSTTISVKLWLYLHLVPFRWYLICLIRNNSIWSTKMNQDHYFTVYEKMLMFGNVASSHKFSVE